MKNQIDFIRQLPMVGHCDLSLVGGKGASLGEMINAGLPVPAGFCMTTKAYRYFVEQNNLADKIKTSTGSEIQKLFADAPMPKALGDQIKQTCKELSLKAVAVRSSATAEDLPDASFAGQQDTYLNVQGTKAIIVSIKKCWGSLWTDRVSQYRQRTGFSDDAVEMGVVVQSLVNADSAGVLFSANPVTGARNEIVINASWGLGESVVSGLVTPDTITIEKSTGELLKADIATKTVMTVRTKTGTQERQVPASRQTEKVLSDSQINQLVELSNKVEGYENHPVDLEWAFVGEQLYLLQARPITALPEPLDEIDTQGHEWSRLMLIERYPDPLTPYTASEMAIVFFNSFDRVFKMMGGELKKDDKMISMFFGRPYINASLMNKAGIQTSTSLETSEKPARKKLNLTSLAKVATVVLTTHRQWYRLQSPYETMARQANAQDWSGSQITELLTNMDQQVASLRPLLDNHANSIIAAELTLQLLNFVCRKWLDDASGSLATTLLAGLEGNMTVKTNHDLWKLSSSIRSNTELCSYLNSEIESNWHAEIAGIKGGAGFLAQFDKFLVTYGHRSPKYEFRHPCWAQNPIQILEMIRMYLDQSIQDPAIGEARQASARTTAQTAARKALSLAKRVVFNRVLSIAQTYFRLRENQQFYLMLAFPSQQQMLNALGTHLVKAGWFDAPDDIYFLPGEQGHQLAFKQATNASDLSTFANTAKAAIKKNRSDMERFFKMDAPIQLGGSPIQQQPVDDAISGIPGSKGIVKGTVRIILDHNDFSQLQPGEILVTPATTPAWTPLFGIAAGLVTDYGGLLSHSGVVAREYGLPAVLGVGNATKVLKTGDHVEIDGTLGTVRKI